MKLWSVYISVDELVLAETEYEALSAVDVDPTATECSVEPYREAEAIDAKTGRFVSIRAHLEELEKRTSTPGTDEYIKAAERAGQASLFVDKGDAA